MIKTKNFKFPQSSFQRYKNHCEHFAIIVELSFKKMTLKQTRWTLAWRKVDNIGIPQINFKFYIPMKTVIGCALYF